MTKYTISEYVLLKTKLLMDILHQNDGANYDFSVEGFSQA
jgi:hypothetical protein